MALEPEVKFMFGRGRRPTEGRTVNKTAKLFAICVRTSLRTLTRLALISLRPSPIVPPSPFAICHDLHAHIYLISALLLVAFVPLQSLQHEYMQYILNRVYTK